MLADLARRERYLALEVRGRRYNTGVKYGLLSAQLALALGGADREEILAELVELLAQDRRGPKCSVRDPGVVQRLAGGSGGARGSQRRYPVAPRRPSRDLGQLRRPPRSAERSVDGIWIPVAPGFCRPETRP